MDQTGEPREAPAASPRLSESPGTAKARSRAARTAGHRVDHSSDYRDCNDAGVLPAFGGAPLLANSGFPASWQTGRVRMTRFMAWPVLPRRTTATPDGDWRELPLIESRLAGGYCLRTAAQGVCAYTNICEHVCPERRARRCRRSCCDSCCAGDGGRPSGFAVQAGSPNRRGVMPVKSRGGKRLRKRPAVSGSGVRRADEHG